MSKKDFTGGLGSILGDQPQKPKVGRPITQTKKVTKSSQEGTKENETRATFIVNEGSLETLKALAYWERKLMKDIVNEALLDVIAKYTKKSGEIKPIPKK